MEECAPQESRETDCQRGASQSVHQSVLSSILSLRLPPAGRFLPELHARIPHTEGPRSKEVRVSRELLDSLMLNGEPSRTLDGPRRRGMRGGRERVGTDARADFWGTKGHLQSQREGAGGDEGAGDRQRAFTCEHLGSRGSLQTLPLLSWVRSSCLLLPGLL